MHKRGLKHHHFISNVFICISQIHYWNMFEILLQKCLSEVGFETTPAYADQNTHNSQQCKQGIILESGALDHSAILTSEIMMHYERLLIGPRWDHYVIIAFMHCPHRAWHILFRIHIITPSNMCRFSHICGGSPTFCYHAAECNHKYLLLYYSSCLRSHSKCISYICN